MRETSASEPSMKHRKAFDDVKTGVFTLLREKHGGYPTYWPCGVRCIGGVTLIRALLRNLGTWRVMLREKAQAEKTARPKGPMRQPGADCFVLARKRGNARGAKGAGHRRWDRANWSKDELRMQAEGGSLQAVARAG